MAWLDLNNSQSIDSLRSETYLDIALANWLLTDRPWNPGSLNTLQRLGNAMKNNHGDPWLTDFLESDFSQEANSLLRTAINANQQGNREKALAKARGARDLFIRLHNRAGAARSEFELVYAFHRASHPEECIQEIRQLRSLLSGRGYHWLETQLLLEESSCEGMLTNFDSAWELATKALDRAREYNLRILELRALGFQASLHTVEGRLKQSWQSNSSGLALFWGGTYPADRGFQFYSDLELAAERSNQWHLAIVLQGEVLQMLEESHRTDVAAMAHFRLVGLLVSVNDLQGAEQELNAASNLFSTLNPSESTDLYKVYSEINLATILLHHGDIEAASQHLKNAGSNIDRWKNFNLSLRYLRAASEVAREKHDPQEQTLLESIVSLGNIGFNKLHSGKDRWDWDRAIGPAYRRLLELKTLQPHDTTQALADWEYYRAKTSSEPNSGSKTPTGNILAKTLLNKQLAGLQNSTLLIFAVFPDFVMAWIADDRGVREFRLQINPQLLANEVETFHGLCSDRFSSLEKVNASGSRLYEWLVAPLESEIDVRRDLFIEADGFLDRIPWSALVMKNGTYFGESHTTINTPGLFYGNKFPAYTGSQHLLAAEPGAVEFQGARYLPLPHAAREAEQIAALYPDKTLLPGKKATANALLAELPRASVFEFAGHAANREYGGELLVHDENGGGITLSASSLSNLRLSRTNLVVLSACSTAAGKAETSTNPNGLVSAFLEAGAESVVASNWDVDSQSTADMMVQFHTLVKDGQSISRALKQSKDSVRANPETSHPFYWAAFAEFRDIALGVGKNQ